MTDVIESGLARETELENALEEMIEVVEELYEKLQETVEVDTDTAAEVEDALDRAEATLNATWGEEEEG